MVDELSLGVAVGVGMETNAALDVGWCVEVIATSDIACVNESAVGSLEHLDASVELASVGVGDFIHTDNHSCKDQPLSLDRLGAAVDFTEVYDSSDIPRKWHLISPNG